MEKISALTGLAFFATSSLAISAVLASRRWHREFINKGPKAKKKLHRVLFGKVPSEDRGPNPMDPPIEREDPYFWLRDESRKGREVLQHIHRENTYTQIKTAHLKQLQQTLYDEYLATMKETDEQVPYRDGPYLYYTRTKKGLSYQIHCRKSENDAAEEVLLDENELARGKDYCDVGDVDVSPTHTRLCISVDYSGYETYTMQFKDLASGAMLDDVLENTSGSMCWGADDSCVYYSTMDEEHRPFKLWLHVMGQPQSTDVCLYTETDQKMWMGIYKTDSEQYLVMEVGGKETCECHILHLGGLSGPAAHLAASFTCVQPRIERLRYSVFHHGSYLFILTNADGSVNHKLMQTHVHTPNMQHWVEVLPHSHTRTLSSMLCFKDYTVIFGRESALSQVWVSPAGDTSTYSNSYSLNLTPIQFPEPVYTVAKGPNRVFDTTLLRFKYGSLITPLQTTDYDMATHQSVVLKEEEVPGYDKSLYTTVRMYAQARDNTRIPISLVYLTSAPPVRRPVLLYGYGSYGSCVEPRFDHKRLSLLNRGVAYAIAHIRGGSELGLGWYEEQGKYLTKKNTFWDFIDCAECLVREGITLPDRLCIVGRSAGGLLMGACVNARPDLFKCVVADVPFVDVLNTMSDPSIPLTVTEWEEWGNPNEEKFFQYMLEYSPYDNVKAVNYPSMLVTGGLHDPRVAYWEPLKWVAKLRELKTDDNVLLCKIDTTSGHFSASDRYKNLRETAFEIAFVLEQLQATNLL